MQPDSKSMTLPELSARFAEFGFPAFRAKQVFSWLQQKGVDSYDEMGNIPKEMRRFLAERLPFPRCSIVKKQLSALDSTAKYLFALPDGALIESVLMQYKYGHTLCVSSQVGCKMGCSFCASAKGGFVRNLSPAEMLGQIHAVQRECGKRISHIVMMGMGEPLDNYDNVLRFLELVSCPEGLHLGMRNISLSTCGLVERMYDLAQEKLQLTLSVSLHAPNDAIRSQSMPVNRRYPIAQLLEACRYYTQKSSRRISFEYAMLRDINDRPEHAQELAKRLQGMLCHVNLIPVNPISIDPAIQPSTREETERFQAILQQNGITATIRRTLGPDIDAACGQLRLRNLQNPQIH